MHDGRAIANFILDYCDVKGNQLTNLQLQKLVYFCHVWHLVSLDEPLVRHKFEAWEFGPVLPYLYRLLSDNGDAPIMGRLTKIDPNTGISIIVDHELTTSSVEFLEEIIDLYASYSGAQLIGLTHVRNGPWWKAWNHDSKINPGMQIRNEEIIEYYSSPH